MTVSRVRVACIACAGVLAATLAACATKPPAPDTATTSPSPVAGPATLGIDTPVQTIVADPAGKAVLDRDLPGLTTHPEYALFKSMSLKSVAGMSNGKITPAALAKVQADLAALPPSP